MRQEESKRSDPIGPSEWFKIGPFAPAAVSDRRGWVGLEAAHCRGRHPELTFERTVPALTHHWLVLVIRPPEALDLWYDGMKRHQPPPAGSVMLVPAGSPAGWRSSGYRDMLHILVEPWLVGRVAAEEFDLDPARLTVPPLDGIDQPQLRAAMLAVDAELAAESLANVLAVHLIRNASSPRPPAVRSDGALPPRKLRAVVEYIEEHLDASLSLEQLAAVARLSPYHFARQFKTATGLPPHQYVILRRVERAKQLLEASTDLSLAEVAADAGFSDQSQFSRHFKRLVGVTPRQFRMSARIA